ncbi:hypothetical protein DEM27_06430 [Metarhizobium album]|uniref:Uncharacterized protein n=1 Tax=Metarhizobium album TaxID=2182425 RepID=A0A2U2DVP6_9HYPH|nr:hypothetical protein [Rhizobium album]PWE57269.1 hypothetical protein DEM27_06430 [Rhizobium album]
MILGGTLGYVKSALTILGGVVAFFTLIALIGGINGDFEEVQDEPAMVGLMWLCNRILKIALYLLWHHPDGVIIFFVVAVVVVTHLSTATVDGYKKEFDRRRAEQFPGDKPKRPRGKGKGRR